MRLSAPLEKSTRSIAADWVEIQVLATKRAVSETELVRTQSVQSEPDHGDVFIDFDLQPVDAEIIEPDNDALSQRVYEELTYRSRVLGTLYPFELVARHGKWSLVRRSATDTAEAEAHDCYICCLLITAIHSELLPVGSTEDLFIRSAHVLQIASYLTAAEIVGGKAFWFGSPRPDGSDMLTSVQNLVAAMGVGKAHDRRPDGLSAQAADGSVDIVVWRPFLDGQPGVIAGYGQVASGRNWKSKPISSFINGKFLSWFVAPPSHAHLEMLFVPILQHHELGEQRSADFDSVAREQARYREMDYGVVIDRLRLTELMATSVRRSDAEDAERSKYQPIVRTWVADALAYASGDT